LNSTCRTRRSSATKLPISGSTSSGFEGRGRRDQPVLHAFGGAFHGLADIDRAEIELHRAGIDGGEIENVVDEREQRVGRDGDVVEIFALLRRQRSGRSGRRGSATKPMMLVSGERNS
jgi:hypothetical protein